MTAMRFLFLAFVFIPFLEIYLLLQAGDAFGVWMTIFLVILTAVVGATLVRAQGLAVMYNLQQQLQKGETPAQTLFDGVCLLIAGALLLTPGFFTDGVGFTLLFPPFRQWVFPWFLTGVTRGGFRVWFRSAEQGSNRGSSSQQGGGRVIEGEYQPPSSSQDTDKN